MINETLSVINKSPLNMENWTGMGVINPFKSYEQIIHDVCVNVDWRIKAIAIALPIIFFAGNWLQKKSHDGKFIDKYGSKLKFPMPVFGFPKITQWKSGEYKSADAWYSIEETNIREVVLDYIVPAFRAMLIYGFGFLIYYTQISGGGV